MGWLEKWGLKLISTQVVVEVEVELGNKLRLKTRNNRSHFEAALGRKNGSFIKKIVYPISQIMTIKES